MEEFWPILTIIYSFDLTKKINILIMESLSLPIFSLKMFCCPPKEVYVKVSDHDYKVANLILVKDTHKKIKSLKICWIRKLFLGEKEKCESSVGLQHLLMINIFVSIGLWIYWPLVVSQNCSVDIDKKNNFKFALTVKNKILKR